MAGYCGYCGTPLDKNGLCPNCGNEDEATGLLTPGDMPAFYTEGQGALFGGGPAENAEPARNAYGEPENHTYGEPAKTAYSEPEQTP